MVQPSAYEQFMLEMVNRARLNPQGEANLYGIGLNDNLAAGTISSDPKQPLAFNPLLIDSSRSHSQWMLDTDTFSHKGVNNTSSNQRMRNAGYQFTGSWRSAENIGYKGTSGTVNVAGFTEDIYENLFKSSGHRKNILRSDFRELGIATTTGEFDGFNALMVTQNFAKSGSDVFLTGVAFDDLVVDDSFYNVGEGLAGIDVTATNNATGTSYTATTMNAGGYQLAVPSGTYDVSFSDDNKLLGSPSQITVGSENIKLDIDTSNLNNTIYGTNGNDTLIGSTGDDILLGQENSDLLNGKEGNDTLNGGDGEDTLYVEANNDSLLGGAGNDLLAGQDGQDTLDGEAGNDTLYGNNNDDLLMGSDGTDSLFGGGGNDSMNGGADNDLLNSGNGNDTVDGGDGDDRLLGLLGNDSMRGGGGNDLLAGQDGQDTLNGEAGSDTLYGNSDNDELNGGNGIDRLFGGGGDDSMNGGADNDTLNGSDGDDTIDGSDGEDRLFGMIGDDLLNGGTNDDLLSGNNGQDTLSGGDGNDTVYGENDSDYLYGGSGIDRLFGGGGNDSLYGGAGNDLLTGQSGMDVFMIESASGTDTIADFDNGVDYLNLSADLSFSELNIINNTAGTATLIIDTTNNNDLLAVVDNVSAVDITADDFTTI